jgi:hypothetical protein
MSATGNRQQAVTAATITLILVASAAGSAQAATCKDELDAFERRLHSSTLAATNPDTFQTLARLAEEAAELRDEQQCLQTVATLNETVPEDPGLRSSRATPAAPGAQANPRRPAAPVLMSSGGDDADESGKENSTASVRAARDKDENDLDD